MVPALLLIMNMTEHQAIGTSLGALVAPVGLLGAIQYYQAGHINPRYSAVVALGIFIGAYFGAKLFVGLSPVLVRRIYAGFLIVIGARLMLVNNDPFTAGAFSDIWWGSKLLDNSSRNGLTWNVGGLASLTALTHVTITGRAYLNIHSLPSFPGGEIRGFLQQVPEPGTLLLLGMGVAGFLSTRRRPSA